MVGYPYAVYLYLDLDTRLLSRHYTLVTIRNTTLSCYKKYLEGEIRMEKPFKYPNSEPRLVKFFKYNKFGPVVVYEGTLGSGTTLGGVIHVVKSKPKKILSNIHLLDVPNYEPLDILKFLEKPEEASYSTLLLDDGYFYLTSRRTPSKENKLWAYTLSQCRKLAIKVIITTQNFTFLDKRIRYMVTDRILTSIPNGTRKLELRHYKLLPKKVWVNHVTEDEFGLKTGPHWETVMKWTLVATCILKRTNKYFKYYDTLEVLPSVGVKL